MSNAEKTGKILVVDDNEDLLSALNMFLKRHFAKVMVETDPNKIPQLMQHEQFDVILLDMNFTKDVSSGHEGYFWLEKILGIDPLAVVVMITAYGDVQTAVRSIKEGATDFVLKPWENEKLLATILSALRLRKSRYELEEMRARQQQISADADSHYLQIIGRSPAMMQVLDTIDKVAGTDANVLLLGENGTGKEVIARAIHRLSLRKQAVFIGVDIGALSDTIFESELFGHVKGAFTDAKENRTGRFEVATGGTLFLDEIGNISAAQQARLLSVLQNRQVTKLGSNKAVDFDVRLICATNMPVYQMVKEGEFRQDLLYRINTIEIQLPPLRQRQEDIPLLADHYLMVYSKKYNKDIRSISEATLNRMLKYEWPGNVRELQHSIERAVILCNNSQLSVDDLFISQPPADTNPTNLLEECNLEDLERILIRRTLNKFDGNITHTARELGMTRSILHARIEKYEIG